MVRKDAKNPNTLNRQGNRTISEIIPASIRRLVCMLQNVKSQLPDKGDNEQTIEKKNMNCHVVKGCQKEKLFLTWCLLSNNS